MTRAAERVFPPNVAEPAGSSKPGAGGAGGRFRLDRKTATYAAGGVAVVAVLFLGMRNSGGGGGGNTGAQGYDSDAADAYNEQQAQLEAISGSVDRLGDLFDDWTRARTPDEPEGPEEPETPDPSPTPAPPKPAGVRHAGGKKGRKGGGPAFGGAKDGRRPAKKNDDRKNGGRGGKKDDDRKNGGRGGKKNDDGRKNGGRSSTTRRTTMPRHPNRAGTTATQRRR